MDLRFIPDDMTFDEQEIKSVCNSMPTSNSYKPSLFFTSALCQSKVDLTWDETDHDRLKVTMRAPSKMDTATEDDFKAYLASSSDEDENPYGSFVGASDEEGQSEESDNEDKHIDKYRRLLQSIQETEKEQENKDVEMEVTWEPGLKLTTEKLLKKKEEEKDSTTWEKYLIKKKEKKQKKREERKLQAKGEKEESNTKGKSNKIDREADLGDGEAAFSDDDVPGGVDMSEFTDELGGDPKVKKGKKKKKKRVVEKLTEEEKKEKATQEAELSLLMMDEKEDDRRHFNLKDLVEDNTSKKKKKKFRKKDLLKNKAKPEDEFKVDLEDERFTAMYSSHMYNLDPTAPEYKRTKGTEAIVNEKLKRSKQKRDKSGGSDRKMDRQGDITEPPSKVKRDANEHHGQEASLQSLIKSVKTKTQNYNIKSKSKR
ncbi:ESF1 homolog [Pecten maximus]|uniref:ESF1 homolog n=1 Tax=Pecten maximus TaxID=6579 RepID=UPI0014584774|nr:ESF1 homolog [Pecten maximus]